VTAPTWLLDLDGVVWLGERTVPGSPDAIVRLRDAGCRVGFCTNNSHETVGEYVARLGGLGVEVEPDDVVSSAVAVLALIRAGERVLVSGGPGVIEAVQAAGAHPVVADGAADGGDDRIDAVVMGFNPRFDYATMTAATRAVLAGARLVATNDDPIYPSADGPAPGSGAILASVERATGRRAEVAGKPHRAMADVIRSRFGTSGVVVGDSLRTDGALATELGWSFGLVLTGNTTAGDVPSDQPTEWVAPDLATLVARRVGS
jgi:HAD superfamily hydrolase (TIGR01450 family)